MLVATYHVQKFYIYVYLYIIKLFIYIYALSWNEAERSYAISYHVKKMQAS